VARGSFLPPDASVVLEGRVSIEAALSGGVRDVLEILAVTPGDRRLAHLRQLASEAGVPIHRTDAERLRGLVRGSTHGGVVALAGPRRYLSLPELLAATPQPAFLALLDGIEDPYNYGQAIRALFAAGAHGLIVRERSWEQAAGTVARASAGASELLPTATSTSVDEAAAAVREHGLAVAVATTQRDAFWLHDADLTVPLLVVVGGERRGVTRSFVAEADLRLRIPYGRRGAHALGAATSAALIGFEILRQRRAAGILADPGDDAVEEGSALAEDGNLAADRSRPAAKRRA
jgi:23S rRNA (guanosine2251-2'-O)-methyltransferase